MPHHERVRYGIDEDLHVSAVRSGDRDLVLVRFSVLEFDDGRPDSRMDGEEVAIPVPFGAPGFERTFSVRVGEDPECQLLLSARPAWIANRV